MVNYNTIKHRDYGHLSGFKVKINKKSGQKSNSLKRLVRIFKMIFLILETCPKFKVPIRD